MNYRDVFDVGATIVEVSMLWDSKINIKQLEEAALSKLDTDILLKNGISAAKKLSEMFHKHADWWDEKVTELEKRQKDTEQTSSEKDAASKEDSK